MLGLNSHGNRTGLLRSLPRVSIERSDRNEIIRDPRLPGSVITASLVLNLLGLALPLCVLQIYDRILPNDATETLAFLIIGLAVVVVLDATLKILRSKAINWIAGAFTYNASLEAFRRLLKAKPGLIETEPVNVHMNRLDALTAVGDFYGSSSRLLYIDVPAAAMYLVIMWLIAQWIVAVPITLLAFFTFLALRRNADLRAIVADRSNQDNRKYEFVTEVLSGIHTVKSMAMEPLMLRRFERLQKNVGMSSYRSILVANTAQNTAFLYSNISTICILTVSALMVILSDVSVGVAAACTLLAGQLIQPLMRGISAWADLQKTRHNFDEAMKLFEFPKVQMHSEAKHEGAGHFCLEEVTFDDIELGRSVIDGFSLSCRPGEIVGLQSWEATERLTLAQLFCGYEKPSQGRILLDGKDLNDPLNAGLKDSIAYVSGAPIVFQGSILDNLTMFGQRADANKARRVAKLLGLEDEINLLPSGYETRLGKGINEELPKSTIQWIGLARAIAADPKVLILDSATQLLDERAAEKVLDALVVIKKDMAIVIISQFEADLAIADRRFDIWGGQLLAGQDRPSMAQDAGLAAPRSIAELGADGTTGQCRLPAPANRVHEQLKQLEAELTAAAQASPDDRLPAAQACLDPLLMALGWHGVGRHLYEALPHLDPIKTLEDLRAVLVRLNYMTRPKNVTLSNIDRDALPCLFISSERIYVLFGFEEDDSLTVFDGTTQQFTDIRDHCLSGIAYFLTPIDVQEERKESQKHAWLGSATVRFKRLLALVFTLGFITNLLALALPIYVMTVYDKAIGTGSAQVLFALTTGIALVLVLDLILRQIKGRAQAYFGARLDTLIGNNAFSQLLYMNVGMTGSSSVGAQITRLRQLENIRDVFTGPLASALVDLPFVFIFIAAIAVIGGPLAWIPTILVVVYGIISAVTVPMIRRNISQAGDAKSRLQNLVMEALINQRAIRNISAERVFIDKFQKLSKDFALKNLRTRAITFNTQTISQTLMLVAGVLTLGIGTVLVLSGALSAGALIGVMALAWRVLNPLHQAFVGLTRLGQTLQSLEQINKLMRLPVERVPNLFPSVYRTFQGRLDLRRLIFSYQSRSEPVLRGFNCSIAPGEIIAMTCASGSGRSTILKVILGLYPLQGGAILADGQDIRQLDLGEWRHAISYVPKDCHLFNGSIAQNIGLSNPTATIVEIAVAAEAAGLLHFEYEEFMPDGLETNLSRQRISAMPEDLKQRIVLARAFVKPASFYLFDSPVQNLSASGIGCVVKKLHQLRGRSTVIMLTQRWELIEAADRVLHVSGGQVAWDGTPKLFLEKQLKAA